MGITSIGQSISNGGAKLYSAFVNSKPLRALAKQYEKDNLSVISGVAVTSIVLKDALGCYMYVNQSLNNKKIPEEKRAFVAALDLANGGLMIAAQLLAFFTINNKKVQEKMFNALFGNTLNRSFRKGMISKLIKNNESFKNLGNKLLNDNFSAFKKTASGALSMVTALVASTIFAKRVVVPFIATPLASYLKDNYMNKSDSKYKVEKDENKLCQKYMQQKLQQYNIENFSKSAS